MLSNEQKQLISEAHFTSLHNHTHYSNIRLLDSINKPKELIDRAIELGYNGVAITDHEQLGALPESLWYVEDLHKKDDKYKTFKFILGNEAYVVNDLEKTKENYKAYKNGFYHLVLLAKDYEGYEQLKVLSTSAWDNSYVGKGMTRTPLQKDVLYQVVSANRGHLICSSACLGNEISRILLQRNAYTQDIKKYKKLLQDKSRLTKQSLENFTNEYEKAIENYNSIQTDLEDYFNFYLNLFGKDFYLELQPSNQPDQVYVNKELIKLAKELNIKWIITTDAHYKSLNDRAIHKAYLNSKNGEREVDDFYATTYLMEKEELVNYLINNGIEFDDALASLTNTQEIYDKCSMYKLEKGFQVPKINVDDKLKELKSRLDIETIIKQIDLNKYDSIDNFLNTDNEQDCYYIYSCLDGLINKHIEPTVKVIDRINLECEELIEISKALGVSLSQYYISMQQIMDLVWNKGDSLVGPGRGSVGCWYTAYLMDITDTDALEWDLPHWRHVHRSKIELSDIDFDTQSLKRQQILRATKEYFGNDKVLNICTYGKEGSKSAVITACRSLGYDPDVGIYLSSLIPIDRGFPRSLQECYDGNDEKEYRPVTEFINQVAKYPQVKEVAMGIEGLINKRGIHASAIVIYNEPYVKHVPMMKAPNGLSVTQYDMHDIERCGGVKYDFLTTESEDMLRTAMDLLIEDGVITRKNTLRETYKEYLHPSKIDRKTEEMWKLVDTGEIINLFQYNTELAISVAKKLQPRSVMDLANGNSLMRLMAKEGQLTPVDKYIQFREKPELWEQQMSNYNLTQDERDIIHRHYDYCYGVPSQQEDIQRMLIDPSTWNYTIGQSTHARKVVSKKKIKEIPALHDEMFENGTKQGLSNNFIQYFWDTVIDPQLGYAFSIPHCISYSLIALQELNLAYHYPIVYWNCACLCINAGAAEDTGEIVELKDDFTSMGNAEELEKSEILTLGVDEDDLKPIIDEMDDDPDEETTPLETKKKEEAKKKKKVKSTDYSKIATAINNMINRGIKIAPPDINRSKFDFRPNAKENEIVYSFKSIDRIGDSLIEEIVKGQPYNSIEDFVKRVKVNRTQIINLIKAGVFDNISDIPKRQLLYNYIASITDLKNNLTLSNVPMLLNNGLLNDESLTEVLGKYLFNKQLRSKQSKEDKTILILENDDVSYLKNNYNENYPDLVEFNGERYFVTEKIWKKIYDKEMDDLRSFIGEHKEELLKELNNRAIKENLLKYAIGTESEWEMKSISFYYSGHELSNIDRSMYSISDFLDLPEDPEVSLFTQWKGQPYPIYKLNTIAGTVIGKNKLRHTVAILTTGGVVYVKFYAEMFSFFDKQISERDLITGKRKVMEKGWFGRGNKILITGIRRGDQFVPKTYKNTPIKQLYLITKVNKDGTLILQDSRYCPVEN